MILVAPDSFKGTFSASEVAAAVAAGLRSAGLQTDECPVADGGEGTVEVMLRARGGSPHAVLVAGPLGAEVRAQLALFGDGGTAVVEAASAAGLGLVEPAARDPERSSTAGVGELIIAARDLGARHILLGAGGTATTDGGFGAVDAVCRAGGLDGCTLTVLCDVETAFEYAAPVFGPQKGADAAAVRRLSARLTELAGRYRRDPRGVPGGGAGGGLAGGLWAALDAELVPGARRILDEIDFDQRLRRSRAVVVGEGRLDDQTALGKAMHEICRRARRDSVPAYAIVGQADLSAAGVARLGLSGVREASGLKEIQSAAAGLL